MTNLDAYKLSLYERCESGDITEEERDVLLEAVCEEDEIDTEMEESEEISDYEESVLNRYEAGLITEEEASVLLEATRYAKEMEKKRQEVHAKRKNAREELKEKKDVYDTIMRVEKDKKTPSSVRRKMNTSKEVQDKKNDYIASMVADSFDKAREDQLKGSLYYGKKLSRKMNDLKNSIEEKPTLLNTAKSIGKSIVSSVPDAKKAEEAKRNLRKALDSNSEVDKRRVTSYRLK